MNREEYYNYKFRQLSGRAKKMLVSLNCSYYRLYALTEEKIIKSPVCGEQTKNEIIDFIKDVVTEYPLLSENIEEFRMKFLDEAMNDNVYLLSSKAKKIKYEEVIYTYKEMLSFLRTIENIPQHQEFVNYLHICDDIAQGLILLCKINQKYGHEIDESLTGYLYHYIHTQNLCDEEVNRIEKIFPTYYDFLNYNIEIERRFTSFKTLCDIRESFVRRVEGALEMDDEEVSLFIQLPDLTSDQRQFVFEYKNKKGIFPVFFIMEHLLPRILTPRLLDILYSYYGFLDEPQDISSIVDKTHLTLGQIFHSLKKAFQRLCAPKNYTLLQGITGSQLLDHYPFLCNSFLTEENTNYVELVREEGLTYKFNGFCILCCFIGTPMIMDMTMIPSKDLGLVLKDVKEFYITPERRISKYRSHTQLVESKYLYVPSYNKPFIFVLGIDLLQFDFYGALYQIQLEKEKRNPTLDWKRYCFKPSLWENGIVEDLIPDVMQLLAYLLNKLWGITFSDKSKYSNMESGEKVNVCQFLFDYIKNQSKPVSVEELFSAFKQEYPQYPFTNSKQIRTYLCKDKRVKPIGRTSLYIVAESVQFKGSLKNAIIEVLKHEEGPMARENLYTKVLMLRPDSSERSLRTILSSMVKDGVLLKSENTHYSFAEKGRR